jgi:hypothetical protein
MHVPSRNGNALVGKDAYSSVVFNIVQSDWKLTVVRKILSVEYYFGKFKINHVPCSKTGLHVYSKNCTVIRYSYRQTCGNPLACFDLFWLSSGRYSTKKNTVMAINVTDLHYHCLFLSFMGLI